MPAKAGAGLATGAGTSKVLVRGDESCRTSDTVEGEEAEEAEWIARAGWPGGGGGVHWALRLAAGGSQRNRVGGLAVFQLSQPL